MTDRFLLGKDQSFQEGAPSSKRVGMEPTRKLQKTPAGRVSSESGCPTLGSDRVRHSFSSDGLGWTETCPIGLNPALKPYISYEYCWIFAGSSVQPEHWMPVFVRRVRLARLDLGFLSEREPGLARVPES